MKHYSKRLYSKFRTRAVKGLETDSFYEYFTRALGAGVKFYGQKHERLRKKIDETWVDALYGSIPALDTIVNRPKKFIEREEVVVPIELARKVGADSVKHLSTHTHLISSVDPAGNVTPNKIMNIYNEESYNLYENRFIVTLIQKACSFVDSRYDAIMAAIGEEFQSTLKVDSSFCDQGETLEYSLQLKLHQNQEYLGSGGESADIVAKIEHIRLVYNSFKRSELYVGLVGCTLVKSPISRTNLMMKNANFKRCYDLWNFLEKYREPGFVVDREEREGEFAPGYVAELNAMILFSYLIMKNSLEAAHNKAADVAVKKRRAVKPKFKSKTVGEHAPDYDVRRPELKPVPRVRLAQSAEGLRSQDDIILAALAKALGEQQVLLALEHSLRAELHRQEARRAEKRRREETILGLLGDFLREGEQAWASCAANSKQKRAAG